MNEDFDRRLTKVENKLEEQQEKNEVLVEMKTLLKMQTEVNAETKEQMKEFSSTLNKVNENLTNLNVSHQQMKTEMNEIGNRVGEIEKNAVENKIDPMKLTKSILSYVGTFIGSILLAYILFKMGITVKL